MNKIARKSNTNLYTVPKYDLKYGGIWYDIWRTVNLNYKSEILWFNYTYL